MTAPWLDADGTYRCFLCEARRTPTGKLAGDPDKINPQLRASHKVLWNRPPPNGRSWSLQETSWYLEPADPHPDEPGRWSIGSDQWATMHRNARPELAALIPSLEVAFPQKPIGHMHGNCTIGGYLVFPNGVDQERVREPRAPRWTITKARACDRRISDPTDLTLEAIRLYFDGIINGRTNAQNVAYELSKQARGQLVLGCGPLGRLLGRSPELTGSPTWRARTTPTDKDL